MYCSSIMRAFLWNYQRRMRGQKEKRGFDLCALGPFTRSAVTFQSGTMKRIRSGMNESIDIGGSRNRSPQYPRFSLVSRFHFEQRFRPMESNLESRLFKIFSKLIKSLANFSIWIFLEKRMIHKNIQASKNNELSRFLLL